MYICPPNDYKYNNKEFIDDLGLNLLDYGARLYDPLTARWNGVDALAEKYHSTTGYGYVLGNPVSRGDIDGRDWYVTNEGKQKGNYVWFDGSETIDGYTHVGQYKVEYNSASNKINVYQGKESTFIESLDMNAWKNKDGVFLKYKTERASKFAMISSESGGLAFKDKNIFIDALIISASIDNRQRIADSDIKYESQYSTYKNQKYKGFHAAKAISYKDFKEGNAGRFNGNLFRQNISLASVYHSLDEPILKLETLGMEKARFIVYYAHGDSKGQGNTAYKLDIPEGTDRMGPVQGDTKHDHLFK